MLAFVTRPSPSGTDRPIAQTSPDFATGIPSGELDRHRHGHRSLPRAARSWVTAASERRSPMRCALPARPSTARWAAAPTPRAPTSSSSRVPDAEIAAAASRDRPRAASSATARAPPRSRRSRPHEAFSLHPLMTVTARGRRLRAAPPAAVAGIDRPRAARPRARSPRASGMRPVERRRRRPRRLPRRRLDRLQLPRHARGRRRARRRHRRRRPRRARAARPRRASTTGPRDGPSARSPARSPAATRPPSPASARPSPSARPTCSTLFDALADATRDLAPRRCPHEDAAHRRRAARRARRARAARAARSASSRRWAPARGPPRADPRAPATSATRSSSRCSSTPRSSTRPPTWTPTRATSRATPRWPPRPAPTCSSRRRVDEVYPPGFATRSRVGGPLTEPLEGAHRGAEHFHGVTTVVTKLLNMVGPDVASSARRTPSRRSSSAAWSPTSTCRCASRSLPTVREPDGLALSSRNVRLRRRRPRAARSRCSRALRRRRRPPSPPATRDAAASSTAAARRHGRLRRRARVPRARRPRDPRPRDAVDQDDARWRSPRRVGEVRLIDNTIHQPRNGRH